MFVYFISNSDIPIISFFRERSFEYSMSIIIINNSLLALKVRVPEQGSSYT